MPLRSARMKRFILGFQRRVRCPKCTPLSSSCLMVTTGAMPVVPFLFRAACEHADALGWYLAPGRTPPRLQEPRTGEVRPAGGRTDIQAASGRANLAGSACRSEERRVG